MADNCNPCNPCNPCVPCDPCCCNNGTGSGLLGGNNIWLIIAIIAVIWLFGSNNDC